ncbi:hypothetical protein GCM10010172_79530 [Paractinoplanes ferrugineus]|uniref:Uncharacterized protein n=1 Tax=Paractinoplanes ferrugineus TaxID=113564 RepID=A0A919J455_9ACTN|nr:hypothetical protein [Actinoplanes ferrugineus]GIE13027.1 hypothetical protein Afe05nite_48670 [Actinoplanes ferrugineus]
MAGTVHALLLKISEQSSGQVHLPEVPLAPGSGLTLLPLTDEIVAAMGMTAAGAAPVTGFYDLRKDVAEWARRLSQHGVVAYVHTEFFGSAGFHAAMAWRDGAIAWGPLFTATSDGEAEEHYATVTDRREMAVNVLLRWLGVQRADQFDEYAAVGLDRCRWTAEWAALLPASRHQAVASST